MARGLGSCFLNDRYADLAVVAKFVVTNDADYLGQPPDEYQLA